MKKAIEHLQIKALAYFEVAKDEKDRKTKDELNDKGLFIAELITELKQL